MQVFLSHRTDADGSIANRLATDLEAQGISAWIAPRDVDAGTTWPRAIEHGLQSSTHAAIILSETTLESRAVQLELQMAEMLQVEGKLELIPVMLRRVELPPWLAVVQWVDLTGSYADGLAALTTALGSTSPVRASGSAPVGVTGRVHRLVRGERVDDVAARWYGSPHEWRRALEHHPNLDPLRLEPGLRLVITGADSHEDRDG